MGLLDLFRKKKLARDARGFQNLTLENLKANFNRNIAVYPHRNLSSQTERYLSTHDIYSLITLLARTAAGVPLYGYLVTPDEKSFSQLRRQTKGYINPLKYKSLQTKALEDLPDVDPVAMLLEKPNDEASKYEFFVQLYSWLFMDGESIILKERPDMGVNQGMPMQLRFIPPSQAIPRVSETLPRKIVAWDYMINGVKIRENIPASDIIHVKYFNPECTHMGDELRGLSPLRALAKILTRIDSNMDVSVAQLQNAGVETIVYDKSLLDASEAVEIIGKRKDNFYKFLNNPGNAGAPYFASGEMGAITLGSTLADLSVIELSKEDFKKLCNAYAVSARVFNNDGTGSEISDSNARRGLYTNAVMPNVFMVRDALINGLLPDFKDGVLLEDDLGNPVRIKGDGKLRFIDADPSEISELQEDIGKQVTALAAASWLTPNEKREVMNYERFDDPLFDEPLIPSGFVPLSELTLPDPVEQVTPLGN